MNSIIHLPIYILRSWKMPELKLPLQSSFNNFAHMCVCAILNYIILYLFTVRHLLHSVHRVHAVCKSIKRF